MNKVSYLFSAILVFIFASTAMAQTTTTVEQEHQNKKQNQAQTETVNKIQLNEKATSATKLEVRKTTEVKREIDLETVEKSIAELEALIEKNKNNPDFNVEAYNKRLTYLKELKAAATAK